MVKKIDAPEEMDTDEDLDEPEVSAWAQNETTRAHARAALKVAADNMTELIRLCADSTDPNIARAYGKYVGSKVSLAVFKQVKAIGPSKCVVELP